MRFLLITLIFFLNSCGFKPMLAKNSEHEFAMNYVKIGKVESEDSIKVERLLEEVLDLNNASKYLYQLDVKVSSFTESQSIQKSGTTSRYRVRTTLEYKLVNIETNQKVDDGKISLYGSYNVAYSDFINFMSDRYTNETMLKEICIELKNRIALVINSKKN